VPKLKPEELESRRNEIIDAARACFLRNGFHRTTTDEIVAKHRSHPAVFTTTSEARTKSSRP